MSYSPPGSELFYSASQTLFSCNDLGHNTVMLTVTVVCGQYDVCEATVIVIDTIDPTIVCPADIVVNNDLGECGAYVSFTNPQIDDIDDNCVGCYSLGNFNDHWESSFGSGSTVGISTDGTSATLYGGNSGSFAEAIVSTTVTCDETISFDWDYSSDESPVWDQLHYRLNGVVTILVNSGPQVQSGTTTVPVVSGDVFEIVQNTADGLFGAATTIAMNPTLPLELDLTQTAGLPSGSLTSSVTINALDDAVENGTRTLEIGISEVVNGQFDPQSLTLNIEDDEGTPTVQVIYNEVLYDPGNSGLDGDANGDGSYDQEEDTFVEIVNVGATPIDLSG